ncbi:transcriptional regulator UhpA [Salinivibrio kushneri]|uniref:transcriptional regulator UhpA n=1 Tax=Salinivibrio kushneri TaxID=1908198 RepID=UPI0009863369|nr:transcriptional regulator UhpA [Salinivibrio kushneri]OOE62367.1 DNA-binding response regulator [Salinivibrio kushneri]
MINVVLIDDHRIVRSGFAQLLNIEPDITVIGEFGSAKEAHHQLPGLPVHVCIMDISMPDESGLHLLEQLPSSINALMLSVHDSASMIERALQLGAKGYLSKNCHPDELIQAVKTVAHGGFFVTKEIALQLASPEKAISNPLSSLTRREQQVATLIAKGYTTKHIAEELGISPKTVHVHRANAMEKLAVDNNVCLAKILQQGV